MQQSNQIESLLMKALPEHTADLVSFVSKEAGVTRMTAHRHLKKLIHNGTILQSGETKGVRYFLKEAVTKDISIKVHEHQDEYKVFEEYVLPSLHGVPENVFTICEYGFSEMFNNVIDHSQSVTAKIITDREEEKIVLHLIDDGIGVFNKLTRAFHFDDPREAVLTLSKGKTTTDTAHHTGEGIFFTSQAFDLFILEANGISYQRDNIENDWFLKESQVTKGTAITLIIDQNSKRILKDLFDRFTDKEGFAFDRTTVLVKLSKFHEDRLISRSQAKRVTFGLEKFKQVMLDFKGVNSVGQGFVDEVFRVFQNRHPNIKIDYQQANENVEFMIKRATSVGSS